MTPFEAMIGTKMKHREDIQVLMCVKLAPPFRDFENPKVVLHCATFVLHCAANDILKYQRPRQKNEKQVFYRNTAILSFQ